VQITERWGALNVLFGDAMNSDIVGIKVVTRVNEPHIGVHFMPILKCHDANLANAAHSRIGGLKVDRNKMHTNPLTRAPQ
jgi:hypothetical protein